MKYHSDYHFDGKGRGHGMCNGFGFIAKGHGIGADYGNGLCSIKDDCCSGYGNGHGFGFADGTTNGNGVGRGCSYRTTLLKNPFRLLEMTIMEVHI